MNKCFTKIFGMLTLFTSCITVNAQNISPAATITGSGCNTGPCSAINNLIYGTCGAQEMWVPTSGPPSSTPGVDWIQWDWTTQRSFNQMTIHHAQSNARFLTGALIQTWNGTAWVNHHTFSNLPMQCISTINFPMATTARMRITAFQMTGTGQNSNPNFREIEVFGPTFCSGIPDGGNVTGTDTLVDCKDSVRLFLAGQTALDNITYQWQYNSGAGWVNFGSNNDTIWSPPIYVPTMFRCNVTCTSIGGGTASSSGFYVNTRPIEVSLGSDTFVCRGASVTLSSDITNGTYLWDDNTTTPTRTVYSMGTYSIHVIDSMGCQGRDTVKVVEIEAPSAIMRTIHLIDRRWLFEATANNPYTQRIVWDFGDGTPEATGFSVNHTYQTNGFFTVTMRAKNVCDDNDISTKTIEVFGFGNGTSIDEITNKFGLKLYPNPASEHLYIENEQQHKISQISITDNLGRSVLEQNVKAHSNKIEVPLQNLASGQYFIHIKLETETIVSPIVIK